MPIMILWLSLLTFAASGAFLFAGKVNLIDPAVGYVVCLVLFIFVAPILLMVAIGQWFAGRLRRNYRTGRPWYL